MLNQLMTIRNNQQLTVDQLFILAEFLKWSCKYAHPVYICLDTLKKAYNCVPCKSMGYQAVVASYSDLSESCVCICGKKSNTFSVGSGLCQSCPLSMILFVIFMIGSQGQVEVSALVVYFRFASMLFADDVVLLASSDLCRSWFSAEKWWTVLSNNELLQDVHWCSVSSNASVVVDHTSTAAILALP